jgi:prepilin-type N-terminal cleavage/methylation domain-containing protein
MKSNLQQKGFTLIELLVVIAIIGILSSVVLASMNTARKKGRDARRRQDLKAMQVALELVFDASSPNAYPAAAAAATISATHISTTYMSKVPTDPTSGYSYQYASTATGSYCLGAKLENDATGVDACGTTAGSDGALVGTALGTAPTGGSLLKVKP